MTDKPVEWIEDEAEAGRITGDEDPSRIFNNWDSFSASTQSRIQARIDLQASRRNLREELGEIRSVLGDEEEE